VWHPFGLLGPLSVRLPSRGQWAVLAEPAEAGLSAADVVGEAPARALAMMALASVDSSRGEFEQALDRLAQAHGIRAGCANAPGMAAALDWLAMVLSNLDQPAAAIGCLRSSLRIHLELGRVPQAATTLHNIGEAYAQLGRYPAAERFLRRCLPLRRVAGDRLGEACTTVILGVIRALCGFTDDAMSWLDSGQEQAASSGYREMEWVAATCRAWVRSAKGDPGAADDCDRAAAVAGRLGDSYRGGIVDFVRHGALPQAVRTYRGPRSFLARLRRAALPILAEVLPALVERLVLGSTAPAP